MLYFTCSNCWRSWDGKPAVTARCVHHVLHPSADRRRSSVTSRGRRALPPVCRRCPPAGWSKQPLSVIDVQIALRRPRHFDEILLRRRPSFQLAAADAEAATRRRARAPTNVTPVRPRRRARGQRSYRTTAAKSCAAEVRTRTGSTRDARGTCSCRWFRRRPRPCSAILVVPARRLDNRTVQPFRC